MISDPALVVVDMQRDYCKPGYAIAKDGDVEHVQPAIDRTADFLERYRATGRTPIFVQTHHDEVTNSPTWAAMYEDRPYSTLCHPDTDGVKLVAELGVEEDDILVTKHRYSAFYNTPLETYLASNGITHLLLAGVSLELCVESTARAAFNRDYEVTILADCTAPSDPKYRSQTEERLDKYFGRVRSADEVLEDLGVIEGHAPSD